MIDDILYRLRALFRRRKVEAELADELRFHFEQQVEKYVKAGLNREEATRQARLLFGGLDQVTEDCRDARGVRFLEILAQDVRYGVRKLRKHHGFTVVAALTLAIGIGASTAVFSVVNAVLLKPLPYSTPDRIVMLWWRAPISSTQYDDVQWPWGPKDFTEFSSETKTIQCLGAFKSDFFNLVGSGAPERLDGLRESAGFFSALGVAPALGRAFTTEEDQPGREYEVILSDQLWRDRFGGEERILGQAIILNGQPYTVVGVMPRGFTFPQAEEMPTILSFPARIQLWVPLAIPPGAPRGPQELAVVGRLNPGFTMPQAEAELRVYGSRVEKEFPPAKGWYNPRVVSLTRQVVGDTRLPLLLVFGAVGVLFLIASSNVASLILTRSLGRRSEFTLRAALGAGRRRLKCQLITESLLLTAVGGLAGILFAEMSLYLVKIFGPSNIPRLREVGLEPRVFMFAIGITVMTGILFGLMPPIGTSRENLVESLKEGGLRSAGSATHARMRNALLVTQIALALVLVISLALLVKTFYHLLAADAGFNSTRVLTFQLSLPSSRYADTEHMAEVYEKTLRALRSLPAAQSVGLVSEVPMGGSTDSTEIRVPDHPTTDNKERPYANYSFASPGYFSAIGTPLLRGRDFAETDVRGSIPVTIINNAMALKYWPGRDPIGRQLGVKTARFPTRTIIGIVPDIKHNSLRDDPDPEMYVPYTQNEIKTWPSMQTMQVALRTKTDPVSLTGSVREALRSVDPELPVAKVTTLTALVDDSMAQPRFSLLLLSSFGGLAQILAIIGMYGVVSYSVQQRTQEIGIRMALGATRRDVLKMVLGMGARLAALGIVIGLGIAWMVTRAIARFLYGIQPTDPVTFATVSALLLGVAMIACYLASRRATRIDPLVALRYE